jgi:hypothetical protein
MAKPACIAPFDIERCDGARASFSNPRGSEKPENMLRIQKGKNETEELRFSSYLVQTAPRIVHRISRNQLVKIKGESTSKAPTNQSSNEMVK